MTVAQEEFGDVASVVEDGVVEGTVDVDVHVAPSSVSELEPYLSKYWSDYLDEAEVDLPPHAAASYPADVASTGGSRGSRVDGAPPDNIDVLRSDFLQNSSSAHVVLNCVSTFGANRNPYFQAAITRAVNDWMQVEWLAQDDRLCGSIVVPASDVKAAVSEIDRLGPDERFVQVLLPVRGDDVRYGNIRYRDIFEAAQRHGLVVGLHAWGRRGSAPVASGFTNHYIMDYLLNSQVVVQEQVISLIAEGVFDQFPELHVALLECGFTWLPAMLMRFEKDWKSLWREVPWMKNGPTHYIYENLRASTAPSQLPTDPADVQRILAQIKPADFLMYASDFPHEHGTAVDTLMSALTEVEKAAVRGGNAHAFYRLRP